MSAGRTPHLVAFKRSGKYTLAFLRGSETLKQYFSLRWRTHPRPPNHQPKLKSDWKGTPALVFYPRVIIQQPPPPKWTLHHLHLDSKCFIQPLSFIHTNLQTPTSRRCQSAGADMTAPGVGLRPERDLNKCPSTLPRWREPTAGARERTKRPQPH